jgi:glycosyltransferase involved in cell wall biosynthesis
MKIDLLHYTSSPVVGGVESVISHHARLMHKSGQEVRILSGRGEETDPGIPFIRVPIMDSRNAEILQLKKALDEGIVPGEFEIIVDRVAETMKPLLQNTNLVIVHNIASLHKNLPLTAALYHLWEDGTIQRLILWHHDMAWTTSRYRAELHRGYPWDLLRIAWPGAQQVTISRFRQHEISELMGLPLNHIEVVPNGLDIRKFFKLTDFTWSFVEEKGLLNGEPLLLLPVRLTPRKNVEFGMLVVNELRRFFSSTMLLVSGPMGAHNPANEAYFKRIRDLRDKLGLYNSILLMAELTTQFLPDDVIADFYRLADALILPSREEGFGIPVLEAGISRMPVFCSDIAVLRELGQDEANYFSKDAHPDEVASMISQRLTSDPTYKLRIRVKKGYTWEKIFEERILPLIVSDRRPA